MVEGADFVFYYQILLLTLPRYVLIISDLATTQIY